MANNTLGLTIDEKEFMKMTPKQQNLVLFKNLQVLTTGIDTFKFHIKVQAIIIMALCAGMGYLLQLHLLK